MNIYRTVDTGPNGSADAHATLGDAHANAKKFNTTSWHLIRIELLDVQTDKLGVVALMNHDPITKLLRTWCLTARGGLKEIENGE